MESLPVSKLTGYAFYHLLSAALFAVVVSSFQFQVGGERGWTVPSENETQSYNLWAAENRFHVGDTLYFKYQNDSVLVVEHSDFRDCVVSNPIKELIDGNSVFQLDQSGSFYFISGQPGHCMAGQKLFVRVMAQSEVESPEAEGDEDTGDGSDGGDAWDSFSWGPPSFNSTVKLSFASYFVTALGGVLIILYLFT